MTNAVVSVLAEGKTDYKARRTLVTQDKNKYGTPKYRLVVRFTNRYVICQVVYSEIDGDKILASAYSSELQNFGVKVGFKNYTAAYLTGLLVAARVNKKLGLTEKYPGNEADGNIVKTEEGKRTYYVAEVDEERKPFRCYLDVGLRPTTTGSRIFGALKGAVDGGLDIPHNEKRFPGYIREANKYMADDMKDRITGAHVAEYMEYLAEEDVETYQKRFSTYIAEGIEADEIEDMYSEAIESIKANPDRAPKKPFTPDTKWKKASKISLEQRKANVHAKKIARAEALAAALADN